MSGSTPDALAARQRLVAKTAEYAALPQVPPEGDADLLAARIRVGGELSDMLSESFGAGGGDSLRTASDYFKAELQGKTVDTQIGVVHMLGSTFREMKRGMKTDTLKAKLVRHVPLILSSGTYNGRVPLMKARSDAFVAFHFFHKVVEVDGLHVDAGVNVGERADGYLAYGLSHQFTQNWLKRADGTLDSADEKKPAPLLASGYEPEVEAGSTGVAAGHEEILPESGGDVNIVVLSVVDADGNRHPELEDMATNPGLLDAAAWAIFDGVVEIRAVLLDAASSPVVIALLAELSAATAEIEDATGANRMRLGDKIRRLTERIALRQTLLPVRLQNRDRSTAASIAQVQSIAKNPDPDLLGYNKTPTEGAPIVFADFDEMNIPAGQLGRKATVTFTIDMTKVPVQFAVVEAGDVMVSHDGNGAPVEGYDAPEAPAGKLRAVAGNGRAAGIQLAYDKGTAANYVAGLIEEADMLQIDPGAISALARPMLIRIMRHADVTADIGDKTNSSGMAGFSAVEQAKTDADRVNFANLSFNEDGTPTLDALTRFVQSMPVAEQAALAPDGSPTNQALDRLMAATFNRAYQNDDLVKLYSQSLDPEIKNVLFGMAQAAGDMAALQGKGDYDIRGFVTDAATMASNAKRAGLPLSRMAEQRDMAMAEESNDIAGLFARSAKRIGDALRKLARAALEEADADAEDMFGPKEKRPPAELVAEAVAE